MNYKIRNTMNNILSAISNRMILEAKFFKYGRLDVFWLNGDYRIGVNLFDLTALNMGVFDLMRVEMMVISIDLYFLWLPKTSDNTQAEMSNRE